MSKQKDLTPIRRCLGCNNKSHHMLWEEEKCPVYGVGIGFSESDHGGLNPRQIKRARAELVTMVRELLPSGNEQQYSSPSKERR